MFGVIEGQRVHWLRELPIEEVEQRASLVLSSSPYLAELMSRKYEGLVAKYDRAINMETISRAQGAREILAYLMSLPEEVGARLEAEKNEEDLDRRS